MMSYDFDFSNTAIDNRVSIQKLVIQDTKVWIKSPIEDDGSYIIQQSYTVNNYHEKINFGPLSTAIGKLFDDGWFLLICGNVKNKSVTLHLENGGRDFYVIAKNNIEAFLKVDDLSVFIKSTQNYLLKKCDHSKNYNTKALENPLDVLKKKYPYKKPQTMIGNLTLPEYVKQQLKSNDTKEYKVA